MSDASDKTACGCHNSRERLNSIHGLEDRNVREGQINPSRAGPLNRSNE